MPVEELNPFRKVLVNPSKHSEDRFAKWALGLQCSGAGTQEPLINHDRINPSRTNASPRARRSGADG